MSADWLSSSGATVTCFSQRPDGQRLWTGEGMGYVVTGPCLTVAADGKPMRGASLARLPRFLSSE